ncbi:phage replication-related protein YjqB (UPF0714/DUF867 family) [Catenuloplanes nepalensis]|uniref:Phage replication-related protein YjqB (UPF0714/DUF867 family) n=1 Tax=Catenuloplanes nepalensis TaxID=587533 RepID=A0ABT9MQZ8_9ACTN|nr:poly-gamma-glutamate hydrolase family protein [Catenuloplanes nepalensis]MDP9793819.1 phage replication-related protein YjqB (UPF0714/DUF867 family) [Catenuloplanes nepalensis]
MDRLHRRTLLAALGVIAAPPIAVATGARPAPAADDLYSSNTDLYRKLAALEHIDWTRRYRRHAAAHTGTTPFPATTILAVHGGGIEPGTSELAIAIAGYHPSDETPGNGPLHDHWLFEGLRPSGNAELHVTSTHCDDPVALSLTGGARRTVSLHGCTATQAGLEPDAAAVLVGGLDQDLKATLRQRFDIAGIRNIDASTVPALAGTDPDNIANRTYTRAGTQLELTTKLRDLMFGENTRARRKHTTTTIFDAFVTATRLALTD